MEFRKCEGCGKICIYENMYIRKYPFVIDGDTFYDEVLLCDSCIEDDNREVENENSQMPGM